MASDWEELLGRVRTALAQVKHAGTGKDILAGGQVRDIRVDDAGNVRIEFMLGPDDPGSLVRDARAAAESVEGVGAVKVDVHLPQASGPGPQPAAAPHAHTQQRIPVPQRQNTLPGVERIIAVSSGKGGVGKSTVAANLAVAFALDGLRIGLLDADIYGPDIPLMFGEKRKPPVTGERGHEKIVPLLAHGVHLMSLGFLLEDDQPAIMRGPLISGILKQFLEQVEWGELDWLIVDMPPGTGDAQLSLVQTIDIDGAVVVTTPQEVSTGDVRRAIRMFERVKTNVLGIVENMSGMSCPHCGGRVDVFGQGGGQRLAEEMEIPLLGQIPLDPAVRVAGDVGHPTAIAAPTSAAGQAFREIARRLALCVDGAPTRA